MKSKNLLALLHSFVMNIKSLFTLERFNLLLLLLNQHIMTNQDREQHCGMKYLI